MKNNIKKFRLEKGWSQAVLGAKVIPPTSGTQIKRLEDGDRNLTHQWMKRIGDAFGCDPADLINEFAVSQPPTKLHAAQENTYEDDEIQKLAADIGTVKFGPDEVLCFGDVNGGGDGIIITAGNEIGKEPMHPAQRGAKSAFAMRVFGDSMFPMYRHGQMVYLISRLQPSKGDGVVVEMESGEGYLKEFIRYTDTEVICKQYNPEKERRYLRKNIHAIHTVVGTKKA